MGGAPAGDHDAAAALSPLPMWTPLACKSASTIATLTKLSQPSTGDRIVPWPAPRADKRSSIGVVANIDLLERLLERKIRSMPPDQTSATLWWAMSRSAMTSRAAAVLLRRKGRQKYQKLSLATMARVKAMLALQKRGAKTFDYGNNLRQHA